jgi:hypothetical protein
MTRETVGMASQRQPETFHHCRRSVSAYSESNRIGCKSALQSPSESPSLSTFSPIIFLQLKSIQLNTVNRPRIDVPHLVTEVVLRQLVLPSNLFLDGDPWICRSRLWSRYRYILYSASLVTRQSPSGPPIEFLELKSIQVNAVNRARVDGD